MDILARVGAKTGDLVFFGAGARNIVNASMSFLRDQLAKDLNLYQSEWALLWVKDFPMFENGEDGTNPRLTAVHHPFTLPKVSRWMN